MVQWAYSTRLDEYLPGWESNYDRAAFWPLCRNE
jgi:hypothetical protein